MYAYQDDPFRTAPPHCAPGNKSRKKWKTCRLLKRSATFSRS